MDHKWPARDVHVFGPWKPLNKKQHYRVCVHPDCQEMEIKDAARA